MDEYKPQLLVGPRYYDSKTGYKAVAINNGEYSLILPHVGNIWLLMTPQLDFYIVDTLSKLLADRIRPYHPDVIVGIASLGWEWASQVARLLGYQNYVPLSKTKKFWYDVYNAKQAQKAESITSKRSKATFYLPPEVETRLVGQQVAVVDDVLCLGGSMGPALRILEEVDCEVVVVGVVLTEGDAWQDVTHYPIESLGHIPVEE